MATTVPSELVLCRSKTARPISHRASAPTRTGGPLFERRDTGQEMGVKEERKKRKNNRFSVIIMVNLFSIL
jgi:hypothetical protein